MESFQQQASADAFLLASMRDEIALIMLTTARHAQPSASRDMLARMRGYGMDGSPRSTPACIGQACQNIDRYKSCDKISIIRFQKHRA